VVLGPRFLIEAGFIIAVAVVAGLADLSTWAIIGVVAGAWIIVALVELGVWARKAPRRGLAPQGPDPSLAPEAAFVPSERVRVPEPPKTHAPPTPPEPEREPEPEPEPSDVPTTEPREWNLWELERLARDHATDDVAKNEERAYLLIYLREFGGPDGTLPLDFDGLVRDAFGDLLHVVTS
jgi:hypothetical protein